MRGADVHNNRQRATTAMAKGDGGRQKTQAASVMGGPYRFQNAAHLQRCPWNRKWDGKVMGTGMRGREVVRGSGEVPEVVTDNLCRWNGGDRDRPGSRDP